MKRIHLFSVLLMASIVVLSSCSTLKEARKIQRDEVPRNPGEYTVSAVDAGLVAGKTLSLSELEEIALQYNPSILQAKLAMEQARLALEDARAGYLPTVGTSASHSRSTHNSDRHRQSTSTTGDYKANLEFAITLYDFGRTDATVRTALENLSAACETYQSKCNSVVYSVRKAYFEVKRADGLHSVAVDAVAQYKDHLDQVTLKKKIGESIAYDVLKAEVDYQNARLNEITTANDFHTALADLNLALGLAENPDYSLGGSNVREYASTAEDLLKQACEKEPTLAAKRFEIAGASASLDAQIAELFPNFKLSFGGNVSGRSTGFPLLWGLSSALSMTQNLFNAGRNMTAIKKAVTSLQNARSAYEASKQSVYRNIRVAVLQAEHARQSLEVAELTARSAERNLDIVNQKYKYGKATSVDRTDAQVSYSKAKAQAVNARYDYLEAQTAIAILVGD